MAEVRGSGSGSAVPVLFDGRARCCGCLACAEVCPQDAIATAAGPGGFLYPEIDPEFCVGCGRCEDVCGFQSGLGWRAADGARGFAAATTEDAIMRSASGGVFGALAREMISRGGVVIGCAYEQTPDGRLHARHMIATSAEELAGMYGSKYVQSSLTGVFSKVDSMLREGREVLFCATPCQVAGLRGFLGGQELSRLLTIDLVCHGVPSGAMLDGYLAGLADGRRLVDARFRPKRDGWADSLKLEFVFEDGAIQTISSCDSSYYDCFLGLCTLRDSCYECPFAGDLRSGDLTIGDFWGVDDVRPDLLEGAGGMFSAKRGISCLVVNTDAGEHWLELLGSKVMRDPVNFADLARHNDQLRHPIAMPPERLEYIEVFDGGGWAAVDALWRQRTRKARMARSVKKTVPASLKRLVKRALGRN